MMICGPVPFDRMIQEANGPKDLFEADGSLSECSAQASLP
jgi:hypothetical protein